MRLCVFPSFSVALGLTSASKFIFWKPIYSLTSLESSKTLNYGGDDDMKNQMVKLGFPRGFATTVLRNGNNEPQKLSIAKLRREIKKFYISKRFDRALEVLMRIETRSNLRLSMADYALRLELTIKVHDLLEAEEYFNQLPNTASQKASCFPLLHGYVKERNTEKAEAFMVKLRDLGLVLNPHLYNEMMKLYLATFQYQKVFLVIKQMKRNRIPRNVLSYNLWMNACNQVSGVGSMELVYKEMLNDENVQVGWSTLCTLAEVYMKAGILDKAFEALNYAEKMLSKCNRLGYFFLITLYANLKNKEGVQRLWKASKFVSGRTTCANYMCVLLSLVKLGDIEEAEKIFGEWESDCRNYDIRVSNVLLGAYVRNGLLDKAVSLHIRTLERGGNPNYKTWEILVEGWMKTLNGQNMDKGLKWEGKLCGSIKLRRLLYEEAVHMLYPRVPILTSCGNFIVFRSEGNDTEEHEGFSCVKNSPSRSFMQLYMCH